MLELLARDTREWAELKKARLSIWQCTTGLRLPFAITDWKGSLFSSHFIFIYWNRVMINLHCQDVPRIGLKELPCVVHNQQSELPREDILTCQTQENEGRDQEMSSGERGCVCGGKWA